MKNVCSPYFDPEFDSLSERIYGPICRVCIDNEIMEDCTVVKVDSVNKQGLLLEVVQVLTDLNLTISKGYISSDAGWFMDVFHVKDGHGHKITDQKVLDSIQQAIGSAKGPQTSTKVNKYTNNNKVDLKTEHQSKHTTIEMTGSDRPGLFSEISAALADLHCNIVEAHAWSHNARLACVVYISDQSTHTPIHDPHRLAAIEGHLSTVLRANTAPSSTWTHAHQQESKSSGLDIYGGEGAPMTDVERRLHQLMLSVRDFDVPRPSSSWPSSTAMSVASSPRSGWSESENNEGWRTKTMVTIDSWQEKGYSIVSIECKDRPRLMFDTVCTLTDMEYVIFHASISSHRGYAFQEYFIRHIDGDALNTESEKERMIKCLEAAIERRVCDGLRLELCANNRIGLLSDITRVLRENGLVVVRADVATQGEKAINVLYVRDVSGNEVDMEVVKTMKREIDPVALQFRNETTSTSLTARSSDSNHHHPRSLSASFGDLFRSRVARFSHNFIPIKQ